jgi:hypothetical protein
MPLLLLQPDAKPFVLLNRAFAPLPWNAGLFLKVRLRASHLILTNGAVTYFRNDQLNDLAASGWRSLSCEQSDDSLCLHPPLLDLFNAKTVQEPYLYPDGLREQYPFVSDVCAKRSGRRIVNGSLYTVSMCDLIDSRAQFVLVEHPDTRRVFFKADSTALVQYACLACVCLYAVATLARHAVLLVKVAKAGEPEDTKTKTDAASHILQFIPGALKKYMRVPVLHVGLSLYLVAEVLAGLPSIATQSETWLALYLAAYVVWDCVFCVWMLYFGEGNTPADQRDGSAAHNELPSAVPLVPKRVPRPVRRDVRHPDVVQGGAGDARQRQPCEFGAGCVQLQRVDRVRRADAVPAAAVPEPLDGERL